MRIDHTVQDSERLNSTQYIYWLTDRLELVLDLVTIFKRPSRRHHYRKVMMWDRLDSKNSSMEKPEVPDDIKKVIETKAIEKIYFRD